MSDSATKRPKHDDGDMYPYDVEPCGSPEDSSVRCPIELPMGDSTSTGEGVTLYPSDVPSSPERESQAGDDQSKMPRMHSGWTVTGYAMRLIRSGGHAKYVVDHLETQGLVDTPPCTSTGRPIGYWECHSWTSTGIVFTTAPLDRDDTYQPTESFFVAVARCPGSPPPVVCVEAIDLIYDGATGYLFWPELSVLTAEEPDTSESSNGGPGWALVDNFLYIWG